jgi:hypothetical protein
MYRFWIFMDFGILFVLEMWQTNNMAHGPEAPSIHRRPMTGDGQCAHRSWSHRALWCVVPHHDASRRKIVALGTSLWVNGGGGVNESGR